MRAQRAMSARVVQRATQQAPNAVVVVFADADAEKQYRLRGQRHERLCSADDSDRGGEDELRCSMPPSRMPPTAAPTARGFRHGAGRCRRRADTRIRSDPPCPLRQRKSPRSQQKAEASGLCGPAWVLPSLRSPRGGAWYFTPRQDNARRRRASGLGHDRFARRPRPSQTAAALPQPAVDTSIVAGQVDDLLEKARLAMRDRRYTAPTGDNALVYYRSALAADPANGEAKDGLRRVGDVLISRFNDAISGAHYSDAALALATLKLVAPSDPHVGPSSCNSRPRKSRRLSPTAMRIARPRWCIRRSSPVPSRPRSLPLGTRSSLACSRPPRCRASPLSFSIASAAMS